MSEDMKHQSVVRRTPFPRSATTPLVPPIVASAVFVARDADHMNRVYEGQEPGFTYAREGSPNADSGPSPPPARAQASPHPIQNTSAGTPAAAQRSPRVPRRCARGRRCQA